MLIILNSSYLFDTKINVIEIKIKSLQTKTETRVNHLKNVILTFVHCFYVQCCFMWNPTPDEFYQNINQSNEWHKNNIEVKTK